MLLRWLLPVVAVLAMLVSSVTAFAASGIVGETSGALPCDLLPPGFTATTGVP